MPEETCKLEKHIASLESDKTNLMKIVDELQIQIKADRTKQLTKEIESLLKQMVRCLYQILLVIKADQRIL